MSKNRKLPKKWNFTSDQNMYNKKLEASMVKFEVSEYDEIGEHDKYGIADVEDGDTSRLEESTWEEKNDDETTEF